MEIFSFESSLDDEIQKVFEMYVDDDLQSYFTNEKGVPIEFDTVQEFVGHLEAVEGVSSVEVLEDVVWFDFKEEIHYEKGVGDNITDHVLPVSTSITITLY